MYSTLATRAIAPINLNGKDIVLPPHVKSWCRLANIWVTPNKNSAPDRIINIVQLIESGIL